MAEIKIQAEPRTEFGKGAARRIRRQAKIPAVLYGRGSDPVHITVPGHDLMLALKNSNALLSIELNGDAQLALPKQVQRDPIKGFIEHADLLIVKKGEKVTVEIPVHVFGEPSADAMVVTELNTITVEAEATHIPESVEVSVEGAEVGTRITAADLRLPSGSTVLVDDEHLVVNVIPAPTAEELEAELAEAEAEAGIEREASDEELGAEAAEPAEETAEGGDEAAAPQGGDDQE